MRSFWKYLFWFFLVGMALVACTQRELSSQAGVPADRAVIAGPFLRGYSYAVTLAPGTTMDYALPLENIGTIGETYQYTPTTTLGWVTITVPLPSTITIAPHETYLIPLHITVPITATSDMADEFRLALEGQHFAFPDEKSLLIQVQP